VARANGKAEIMKRAVRWFLSGMAAAVCAMPVLVAAQNHAPIKVDQYAAPVKLACVGDSITQGVGAGGGQSWPDQLGRMLGEKWTVRNFGVSGTTLMNSGDNPYQKQGAFTNAKALNPDVVVIALGTNDTKPQNMRNFAKDFEADYKDLIKQFADLPSKPRIFICRPPFIAKGGNWGINEPDTLKLMPVIEKIAKETKVGVIDVHNALKGHDAWIPDNVHPNAEGAKAIATAVCEALTGNKAEPAATP
jgi:acyl-CoA thioesterase I